MGPKTDLTGKVAVITGAAHDIGLALALYAADRGMMVALADENEYLLAAALEQVKAKEVEAIAVHNDMLDFAALRELARRSAAELGPPWLVCNNPGVSIEATLWGVINGVQVFAPDMVDSIRRIPSIGGRHDHQGDRFDRGNMSELILATVAAAAFTAISAGLVSQKDAAQLGPRSGYSYLRPEA
jgi:NAD(P)-dependent dehydrogenase (short-subunit alcohol dehydrogenase family)